jgi:hypothetical protein
MSIGDYLSIVGHKNSEKSVNFALLLFIGSVALTFKILPKYEYTRTRCECDCEKSLTC